MKVDKLEATRFLDLLGGHERNHHFQTFDDKKGAGVATTEEGAFVGVIPDKLEAANRHGGGVFVAINTHTPKKARTKANIQHINALFIDFDDEETAKKSMLEAVAVLPATVVVESSPNKFHVYWVLSNTSDISPADFPIWQKMLIKTFGSDPAIHDTSRVMRMVGFVHQKGEPFVTRIIEEYTTGKKYNLDELVSAFYGGRNKWITSVAGRMRHAARPQAEITATLVDYNSKLSAPLDEDEIERIALNIERYTPDPKRQVQYDLEQHVNSLNLELTKQGKVIPNPENTAKVVRDAGMIIFNKFAMHDEVKLPVPWERNNRYAQWSDLDTTALWLHLCSKYKCDFHRGTVDNILQHAAQFSSYDPLIDYLESLKWDGGSRVSDVLHKYLAVEDTPYNRAVSEILFVTAVRRAYEAGCKADMMVVLVGGEGGGKSKFVRTIAKFNDFFTDSIGDLRNKDAVIGLRGKWIVEFAELKSMQGASGEHTKAFLSTQVDNIRDPYGRRVQPNPRRCIFVGTTNNENFITDSGANRRFLPVHVPMNEESGHVMDYKELEKHVDQLWAEAVHMYKHGHSGHIPPELVETTIEQRMLSTDDGGYVMEIIEYMMDDKGNNVNGERQKRTTFVPRDFYLSTVENASKERWQNENRLHKHIMNSARKVFAMPEWSNYKYSRYKAHGVVWRGWKLVE